MSGGILEVTVPWPPANVNTNSQWRIAGKKIIQRPEAAAYKTEVAVLVRQAWQDAGMPLRTDLELAIALRQVRPNHRRRDVDSNIKILLDAVAVALGIDDKVFTVLSARIDDLPDKANPRIEIVVTQRSPGGAWPPGDQRPES